jgi:hypothetical protein
MRKICRLRAFISSRTSLTVSLTSSSSSSLSSRSFASRNGASGDSSETGLGASLSARGASWYDPLSIERRLQKVRGPPKVDPTTGEQILRTEPKKSEEELWFEAGLYSSKEGRSNEGLSVTKASEISSSSSSVSSSSSSSSTTVTSSSSPSSSSSSNVDEAMKDVALFAQGRGTLVRVSTAEVHRRQLSSFTKAFELVALPAYQKLEGLVSIRLLIDDDSNVRPATASPTVTSSREDEKKEESEVQEELIMKPKRRLYRSQDASINIENVMVTNITEWISLDALQKAIEDEKYLDAMKVLGGFFRGKSNVKNTTQFLAYDVRY